MSPASDGMVASTSTHGSRCTRACQRPPSVRSLVVKSPAAVYGCGPKDPAKFSEDMEPWHAPTSGWASQ